MDEYKHCMNTLLARSKLLEFSLSINPSNKERHNKQYEELVNWFKETYELKRKIK